MFKIFESVHQAMAALAVAKRIGYNAYISNEKMRGHEWGIVILDLINDH